ncbi:MAG TPA: class I SAM-dependent methyltransferase, partial [Roseiarcus sp.]|nr:class I SAM-dependent methyltransferase [Roseiarcus sp.]
MPKMMAHRSALEVTSADKIDDPAYRTNLVELPRIISSWVEDYLQLESSRILDFGCGDGTTALGFALYSRARSVVGVDIMEGPDHCAPLAQKHLGLRDLPAKLSLHRVLPGNLHNTVDRFDLIYSWSVFEHVEQNR